MEKEFLTKEPLPFCKGCGHSTISRNTEKALQKLNLNLLDVILVTDIGCHGIIDKSFLTHTVHGLHGRSVALAAGISLGVSGTGKKVIVFMGDGSATIGMQHLIDSAHNNDDMTVVIHNNMLYGMTGGQPSEFTPRGFKTPTLPGGAQRDSYDICDVVTAAGANYVRRIYGIGDFSDAIAEAISRKGFSLVEVMEICPSYGVKANPGIKLKEVSENAGLFAKVYADRERPLFIPETKTYTKSLIDAENFIDQKFEVRLDKPKTIMISGSAGEGVQAAAEFLAKTAIVCGLSSTKKGSYPVTVGIGFSAAMVIVSPVDIVYTGSEFPDILIVSSEDGLGYAKKTISSMPETSFIYAHTELEMPATKAQIVKMDFRTNVLARNISMYSLYCMLKDQVFIPAEALVDTVENSKLGEKTDVKKLFKLQDA